MRATYPPYGKRILLDNGWFRTLTRPNVELVTDPIDHFASEGIVASDGKVRPADIIVVSTGFKVTEMAARLNITGRDGKNLADVWAGDNPTAYLASRCRTFRISSACSPELRPGAWRQRDLPVGMPKRYITACLVDMIEHGIAAIDVHQEVHDDYVREVDREHEQMIWTHPGMTTYYRNSAGGVFRDAMAIRGLLEDDPRSDLSQYRQTPV